MAQDLHGGPWQRSTRRLDPVNDLHGHHVGDALLVEVAARMQEYFRAPALVREADAAMYQAKRAGKGAGQDLVADLRPG